MSLAKTADDLTFQLTRSRGAWLGNRWTNIRSTAFQLTRSRGAWHDCFDLKCSLMLFQLTRSRGAWPRFTALTLYYTNFNSHAHVERDSASSSSVSFISNFNSHAHVERDIIAVLLVGLIVISTHTLTWSVTYHWNSLHRTCRFQLTRSRGAWPIVVHVLLRVMIFQLTRSRGAWLLLLSVYVIAVIISTHTLTWSVTSRLSPLKVIVRISTHTLTWSVTRTKCVGCFFMSDFNSHAHVERDLLTFPVCPLLSISTHTLTWSVTLDVVYIWCLLNVMRTYFFI